MACACDGGVKWLYGAEFDAGVRRREADGDVTGDDELGCV